LNILSDLKFLWKCLFFRRAKGVYLAHEGFKNLGDEALREAVYGIFKSKLTLIHRKGRLVRFFESLGLVRFGVLMLGGGTFIFKSQRLLGLFSGASPVKAVFGTGVEDPAFWEGFPDSPSHRANFEGWTDLLRSVRYIGVRGPASKRLLLEKGCTEPVHEIGDPVLYFLKDIRAPKARAKRLGFNVGTTEVDGHAPGAIWGRDEAGLFAKFANFLKIMDRDGWSIEAVPVCREDAGAVHAVISMAGLEEKVRVFDGNFSVEKTVREMESFDLFIGQKLHSVILAYCANTPAVMVEYMPKCRDFMESIGMSEFNVRTDEFEPTLMKELVSRMYSRLEDYRLLCHQKCADYRKKLMAAGEQIVSLL